ncbi:MAG TPA: rhodanese-like domain-containing protein, partial [Alphaproteobacteria bacterium]|nr:rhodanese-like domain-containing protein [Alphaproteobacteria bacterium]
MNINNISVDNLRSENPTETLIIDVREPNEYNAEHIIGAINIPLSKIDIKLVNLANLNKNKIVLYCQSGKRSLEAYKKIINTDNLSNLEGGINLWKEKSFPTNFMKKLLPIERQIQIAMGSFLLIGIILSIIVN